MFGSSRSTTFLSYDKRRRRRVPRWLMLLLFGIAVGAGGLYVVQERYLPQRLSAAASAELRGAFESADAARTRLAGELAQTTARLTTALAEKKSLTDALAARSASVETLRSDLVAVVSALPPDPRGGPVEIRAARFVVQGATLAYEVLLTRERGGAKPLAGVVQLAIVGDSSRGASATFSAPAEAVTIGAQQMLRGSVALPAGFRPREVTVQVVDRAGGRSLGRRVLRVK